MTFKKLYDNDIKDCNGLTLKEVLANEKPFKIRKSDQKFWDKVNFKVKDLPGEIWEPIPGWRLYEASNYGRIKRTLQERFYRNGKSNLLGEKLMSISYSKAGYAQVTLNQFGRKKTLSVHRLVADAFDLPYESPEQKEVHHKDGNPRNNRLENLKRCTPNENKMFNNRGKKVSKGRKAYLAGLSAEERQAMSERAYKKCMRKIFCGGKVYDCLKDFAGSIGLTPAAVHHWLNGKNQMPDKYLKLGLKYA